MGKLCGMWVGGGDLPEGKAQVRKDGMEVQAPGNEKWMKASSGKWERKG